MFFFDAEAVARRVAIVTVLALAMAGCRTRNPVIDPTPKPPGTPGTLSGSVRSTNGDPLGGRQITITSLDGGGHYEATTTDSGGYTIKLPAGKYRLQVQLRQGESLQKGPAEVSLNDSDLDPRRDFVIANARP
jgi:hypothetical protein